MRYRDFKIVEAALSSKKYFDPSDEKYNKSYQQKLINAIKSKTGGPVYINKDTPVFFNTKETREQMLDLMSNYDNWKDDKKWPTATAFDEDGESVTFSLNKIEKKFADDKGRVAVSVNTGNVTEGVLGLAIATKFANTSKTIDQEEVLALGKRFLESGDTSIVVKVTDRTDDDLRLKITLPGGDTQALKLLIENNGDGKVVQKELGLSDEAGKKLDSLFNKCTNYANTGEAPKQAVTKIQGYYKDGVKQVIEVTSDGAEVENQNMTKVDLKLVVAGEETETLSLLSLKAGGGRSQIGQSSGKPFKNLSLFWKQNFNYMLPNNYENLWNDLYKKLADDKGKVKANNANTKEILLGPIKATYEWAADKISKHLAGDRTEGEIEFLDHMQQGLLFHSGKNIDPDDRKATAVKGDEDVIVTIIDFAQANDYYEIRFTDSFKNIMSYFDLESTGLKMAGGDNGMAIQIIVKPVPERLNDDQTPEEVKDLAAKIGKGKVLVQYRSYIQQKTNIRNIVEIDKGAKILAAVSNEKFNIPKAMTKQQEPTDDAPEAPVDQTKVQPNDPNATV